MNDDRNTFFHHSASIMEQFSSPKHIRENEFVRLMGVCMCGCGMGLETLHSLYLSHSLPLSLLLFTTRVCMWKISGAFFFLRFPHFSLSLEFIFLIYILIRKLIFQEKAKPKKNESYFYVLLACFSHQKALPDGY